MLLSSLGRTLEEIDTMYLQGVLPWKSASWVAPPPEEIARIRKEAGMDLAPPDPENQIQQHLSREQQQDAAAAREAAQEKERELDRSSGEDAAVGEHREGAH